MIPTGTVVALSLPSHPEYADVQFHNLAVLNAALAAYAVNHLVVRRDANIARKNAVA